MKNLSRTIKSPTGRALRGMGWHERSPALIALFGCFAAVFLGFAATRIDPVAPVVGLVTLLPVASHVRWVGVRRAISEPSAVTFILFFYLSVFPQRGIAIVANHFTDVAFVYTISSQDLVAVLVLASVGTTVLIEAFHWRRSRENHTANASFQGGDQGTRLHFLAAVLGTLALVSLALIILQNNGLAGATSVFLSHSKAAATGARSFASSIWAIVAVPAVWCAAGVAVDRAQRHAVRFVSLALGVSLLLAQLVVFGSRLNALLALMGAWLVLHYSGRSIPVLAVLASIPVVILVSVPIVSQRPGVNLDALPPYERYSRIVSYGVLDASLAVRQHPEDISSKLREPGRWLELPAYLVPSVLWPGRPTIDSQRMDVFVAQTFGNQNQQDTGFPTSYLTELSLYGGWLVVVIGSGLFGALLGTLHRRLLVAPTKSKVPRAPAALIWYCAVAVASLSYYKDGDLLMNIAGTARTVAYLAAVMLLTGVWSLNRPRTVRAAPAEGKFAFEPGTQVSSPRVGSKPPLAVGR